MLQSVTFFSPVLEDPSNLHDLVHCRQTSSFANRRIMQSPLNAALTNGPKLIFPFKCHSFPGNDPTTTDKTVLDKGVNQRRVRNRLHPI